MRVRSAGEEVIRCLPWLELVPQEVAVFQAKEVVQEVRVLPELGIMRPNRLALVLPVFSPSIDSMLLR